LKVSCPGNPPASDGGQKKKIHKVWPLLVARAVAWPKLIATVPEGNLISPVRMV
jgi:hypothetical protein